MKNKITIESAFSEQNISRAIRIISKKDVSPGVDGMHARELPEFWEKHRKEILKSIKEGTYEPAPLNIVFISKPGKKEKRELSISTALDQMLQQCIRFELERCFTEGFHRHSYGFIKGRGTQDALKQSLRYMNLGMTYVIDADIKKCFDSIKHRIVMTTLEQMADKAVLDLIRKYLKNPGKIGNGYRYHRVGVPQGSSISQIIANIILNNLDWYLHSRHMAFVRYADDLLIFCKSKEMAEKQMKILKNYLLYNLSLRLNEEKTTICMPEELQYLGCAFRKTDKGYTLALNDEIQTKMKEKMMNHISRKDIDTDKLLDMVGGFNRGWINYYSSVYRDDMLAFLKEVEKKELDELLVRIIHLIKDNGCVERILLENKGFVSLSVWYEMVQERSRNYDKELWEMEQCFILSKLQSYCWDVR